MSTFCVGYPPFVPRAIIAPANAVQTRRNVAHFLRTGQDAPDNIDHILESPSATCAALARSSLAFGFLRIPMGMLSVAMAKYVFQVL